MTWLRNRLTVMSDCVIFFIRWIVLWIRSSHKIARDFASRWFRTLVQFPVPVSMLIFSEEVLFYYIQAVTDIVFEKHLSIGLTMAESLAQDTFHCQTKDCPNWCFYDGNISFDCPSCKKSNCISCRAIHTGKTCQAYQKYVDREAAKDKAAEATKKMLQVLWFHLEHR